MPFSQSRGFAKSQRLFISNHRLCLSWIMLTWNAHAGACLLPQLIQHTCPNKLIIRIRKTGLHQQCTFPKHFPILKLICRPVNQSYRRMTSHRAVMWGITCSSQGAHCPWLSVHTSCSCCPVHPSLATADAGQHIRCLVPQWAPQPPAASARGAGETAPEESQQPGGGEEHAVQCHSGLQAEDREHAERPGGEDQWAGEGWENTRCHSHPTNCRDEVEMKYCFLRIR